MASVLRGSGDSSFGGNLSIEGVLTYEDVASVDSVGIITARSGIDVGTGTSIFSPSSNVLTLGTNSEERLRITSAGLIGINTTPGTLLEIKGESSKEATVTFNRQPVQSTNDGVIGEFMFENATDSVALLAVKRESAADDAYFQFATQATGGGLTEKLRITSTGQLQATGAADVRLTLGSSGTAGTNDSVHIRADSADLKFMAANGGTTIFERNGTETLRITSGGDLGLGVSDNMDQAGTLYIVGGQGVRWSHPTDGTLYGDHYVNSSGNHVFRCGSSLSERLRIDSSGALTHTMNGSLVTTMYNGSVTDNGNSGSATFNLVLTFPDSSNYFICEVIGYHNNYTGANEYYRFMGTHRLTNDNYQVSELDDLTSTGSYAQTNTTVTLTGRRPRSNTGTSVNSTIRVILRSQVAPTSVTIGDS